MILPTDRLAAIFLGTAAGLSKAPADPSPWWVPIVVTLLSGGTLAAIFSFVKWGISRRDQRQNGYQSILRDQTRIQHELNLLISEGGAVRAFVCRMTNGGGIPRRGACLFLTVSYEATGGKNVPVILDDWQMRRMDPGSQEMLLPMLENGSAEVNSDDLSPSSDMAISWTSAAVKLGRIYEIGQLGNEYFFIALHYLGKAPLTSAQSSAVNDSVAKIRQLVKKGPCR